MSNDEHTSASDPQTFWACSYEMRLARVELMQGPVEVDHIDAFDAEINAAMNAVAALRYRRNRLLPIFRLPPEVLLRVMQECSGFYHTRTMRGIEKSWLCLTHVCKTFRDIAIACPMLWTDVNTKLGHSWTQEFLARSNGTLHGLHTEFLSQSPIAETLVRHMATLEHLSVQAADPTDSEAQTLLLASCSPDLKEAILLGCERAESGTTSSYIINNAPLLRDLTIVNFDILWKPSIWPSLHTLKVDFSWLEDDGSFVESFENLVECLRASPELECLEFRDCLLPSPSSATSPQKVALSRLSSLTVRSPATDTLDMLETIEAPHLVKLDIQLSYPRRVENIMIGVHAERLATVLKTYRTPLYAVKTRPMSNGHGIYAYGPPAHSNEDLDGACLLPWSHRASFGQPKLCVDLHAEVSPEAIALLLGAFQLEDLHGLSIGLCHHDYRGRVGWDKRIWQRILVRCHNLQALRVYRSRCDFDNTPVLCRLLATSPPENVGDNVYLPSLKDLTIASMKMGKQFMGTAFYQKLIQFLHRRAGLGAGIRTLRFKACPEAIKILDDCFLRVPGIAAVEHTGNGDWDRSFRIHESDVETCMNIGPGDVAEEDAQYPW